MEDYKELRQEALEVIEARKNWAERRNTFNRKAYDIINSIKDLDKRKEVFEYLYGHEGDDEVDAILEYHIKKNLNKPDDIFG